MDFAVSGSLGMNVSDLSEEISPEELDALEPGRYLLIDIRTQEEYEHGFIPGCVLLSAEQVREMAGACCAGTASDAEDADTPAPAAEQVREMAKAGRPGDDAESGASSPASIFDGAERIVIYCRYGLISRDLTQELRAMGLPAQNLAGGYGAWALHAIREQARNNEKRRGIELGIQKGAFHRDLLNPFARAILRYEMIQDGDHIAVCISGGKDSMLMAKLFQEFQRHGQFRFDLTFLCMDPGYSEANRRIIESNADLLGIPLEFFETDIFETVYNIPSSPCYLCARMRRGWLYKAAKERGCNKIALGHHYDDVIETVFMGMLYSGQWAAMMPKLRSTNFEDMELIRPMYFIREDDIKRWRDVNHLHFIQCACRFTDTCTTCAVTGADGGSACSPSPGNVSGNRSASTNGSAQAGNGLDSAAADVTLQGLGQATDDKVISGRCISTPAGNGNCTSAGSASAGAGVRSSGGIAASPSGAAGSEHSGHKRTETKRLIAQLKKTNPDIETNLFHATENVHIDKLLGYTKDGARHTFLEDY